MLHIPCQPCCVRAGALRRLGVVVIGLMVVGCQKPEPPPTAYQGPTLVEADLGMAQPVKAPETGYVLLDSQPSRGRFPAALAVVRLDKPDPLFVPDGALLVSERGWEVADLPSEEATWWNGLLKTVPMTRAVYVLDRGCMASPDCDLKQVIEAARRFKLELCLIYGPRSVSDGSAGLAGAIIEVSSGQYLAYIQAEAGPCDVEPPRPDRPKHDLSHQDVNYLAARRFERQARSCVIDMIGRDQPAPATQPNPWRDFHENRFPANSVPAYIVPNYRNMN
jgi:hypothetical protein